MEQQKVLSLKLRYCKREAVRGAAFLRNTLTDPLKSQTLPLLRLKSVRHLLCPFLKKASPGIKGLKLTGLQTKARKARRFFEPETGSGNVMS